MLEMIFDRTQEDIDRAKEIIEDKVKIRYHEDTETYAPNKTEPMTEEEKKILEKCTYNKKTVFRIEEAFSEIKKLLLSYGYDVLNKHYKLSDIEAKSYGENDVFEFSDFERWSNNLEILRIVYAVALNSPETPTKEYTQFETTNAIERILYDVQYLVDTMIALFKECGNAICGEE